MGATAASGTEHGKSTKKKTTAAVATAWPWVWWVAMPCQRLPIPLRRKGAPKWHGLRPGNMLDENPTATWGRNAEKAKREKGLSGHSLAVAAVVGRTYGDEKLKSSWPAPFHGCGWLSDRLLERNTRSIPPWQEDPKSKRLLFLFLGLEGAGPVLDPRPCSFPASFRFVSFFLSPFCSCSSC